MGYRCYLFKKNAIYAIELFLNDKCDIEVFKTKRYGFGAYWFKPCEIIVDRVDK
jgi:hypothetical protein